MLSLTPKRKRISLKEPQTQIHAGPFVQKYEIQRTGYCLFINLPFSTNIGQLQIFPYILIQILEVFSMKSWNSEGENLSTAHGKEIHWIVVVFATTIQSTRPINNFAEAKI